MEADNKRDLNEKLLIGENDDREDGLGEKKEQGWCSCCTKLNNKTVLFIVCILFACFATSEVIAAVVSTRISNARSVLLPNPGRFDPQIVC